MILPPRRALGRIGSAYIRKEDYDNGIKYLNKSLTEHRTPDILAKLKDAERQQAEKTRLAYIDPAKAEAAREQGNVAFKAGDFAKSVEHYGEAIKRNPSDPKGYSNRAAALTKLMALPEALKDADKAIEVDPTFGESPCPPPRPSLLPAAGRYSLKSSATPSRDNFRTSWKADLLNARSQGLHPSGWCLVRHEGV